MRKIYGFAVPTTSSKKQHKARLQYVDEYNELVKKTERLYDLMDELNEDDGELIVMKRVDVELFVSDLTKALEQMFVRGDELRKLMGV